MTLGRKYLGSAELISERVVPMIMNYRYAPKLKCVNDTVVHDDGKDMVVSILHIDGLDAKFRS